MNVAEKIFQDYEAVLAWGRQNAPELMVPSAEEMDVSALYGGATPSPRVQRLFAEWVVAGRPGGAPLTREDRRDRKRKARKALEG